MPVSDAVRKLVKEHDRGKLRGFQAQPICAKCAGKCCKLKPGIIYPEDLGDISVAVIADLLKTMNYAIDRWDNDDLSMTLYLLPRTKGGAVVVPFCKFGGECIFLDTNGCQLAFYDRPLACRMLEPGRDLDDECDIHGYSQEHGKDAWVPFQTEILGALDFLGYDRPEPPSIFDAMMGMVDYMRRG